jgi:hypothetical protein
MIHLHADVVTGIAAFEFRIAFYHESHTIIRTNGVQVFPVSEVNDVTKNVAIFFLARLERKRDYMFL